MACVSAWPSCASVARHEAPTLTHHATMGLVMRPDFADSMRSYLSTPPILPNSSRILVLASPWRPRKEGSRSRLLNKWCPHGLRRVFVDGAGYYSVMERHNRSPSVAASSETRSELQKSILLSSFDMPPGRDPHASEPGW